LKPYFEDVFSTIRLSKTFPLPSLFVVTLETINDVKLLQLAESSFPSLIAGVFGAKCDFFWPLLVFLLFMKFVFWTAFLKSMSLLLASPFKLRSLLRKFGVLLCPKYYIVALPWILRPPTILLLIGIVLKLSLLALDELFSGVKWASSKLDSERDTDKLGILTPLSLFVLTLPPFFAWVEFDFKYGLISSIELNILPNQKDTSEIVFFWDDFFDWFSLW
jgi:hypothetical protein